MIKKIIPFAFLMAFAAVLSSCKTIQGGEGFYVSSSYKSWIRTSGGRREGLHPGVDFKAPRGTEVIAAHDGEVVKKTRTGNCGNGVVIAHYGYDPHFQYTVYCHLLKHADLWFGKMVKRGEIIGWVGATGGAGGVNHLHFELSLEDTGHRNGDTKQTRNPMSFMKGCYDPVQQLPKRELLLTFPIPCSGQIPKK